MLATLGGGELFKFGGLPIEPPELEEEDEVGGGGGG